jgi:hypothetical protein
MFDVLVVDEAHQYSNAVQSTGHSTVAPLPKYREVLAQLQRAFTILVTGTPIRNHTSDMEALLWMAGYEHELHNWQHPETPLTTAPEQPVVHPLVGSTYHRLNTDHPNTPWVNLSKLGRLSRLQVLFRRHSQRAHMQTAYQQQATSHQIHRLAYPDRTHEQTATRLLRRFRQAVATQSSSNVAMNYLSMARLFDVLLVPLLADLSDPYPGGNNPKFRQVAQTLASHPTDKIVITSSFSTVLVLLAEFLDTRCILYTGSMTHTARRQALHRFHMQSHGVLLLSKKTGGTGLNLLGVDRLILMEPHPTFALDSQVQARVVRLGQTQPVVFEHYLMPGVDQWLWESHKRKLALSSTFMPDTSVALNTILGCSYTERNNLIQQVSQPVANSALIHRTWRHQRYHQCRNKRRRQQPPVCRRQRRRWYYRPV